MKDVFKYELKKGLPFFMVLLGIGIGIYLFILLGMPSFSVSLFTMFIGSISFAIIILLVFYNFGYNKKKISLDLYYALPVTHKELFLAKYLFTLMEIVIMFITLLVCTYLFAGVLSLAVSFAGGQFYLNAAEELEILCIVLIQLLTGIGLMNIILLFFNLANNYLDAVLYILIIILIPAILLMDITYIIEQSQMNNLSMYSLDFGLYSMLGSWCEYYILETSDKFYTFNLSVGLSITVLCLLSFIPLYFYSVNSSSEKVELPDTKIFGYKIFVPLLFILLNIYFSLTTNYIISSLLLFGGAVLLQYIAYAIFERKIKISKVNRIVLASTVVIGIILMLSIN